MELIFIASLILYCLNLSINPKRFDSINCVAIESGFIRILDNGTKIVCNPLDIVLLISLNPTANDKAFISEVVRKETLKESLIILNHKIKLIIMKNFRIFHKNEK